MTNKLHRPLGQVARGMLLSTMLSGCLYGQNKQFFEYSSASFGNGDGLNPGNGGGGSISPTPSPISTPFATPAPTVAPTATPLPTPVATATPAPTAAPTATPMATATPSPTPIVVVTPTPAQVCDPLNNGSDGSENRKNGIKGALYSYENALRSHPYHSVNDFFTYGDKQNVDLFLSSLYTPTRAFDTGFMTSDGNVIKKSNGEALFEYFAMKLTGGIQLPQGARNKIVQFAVLSDDGAKLRMLQTSPTDNGTTIVDNDGDHATRMACSSVPVQMSASTRVPFVLDYYQGPRMHIALVLMWREWTPGMNANDPWCNQSGNDLFWNSNTSPSTAQSAYNDISTRWQVVPSNVFYINGFGNSNTDTDNPCANQ